MNIDKIEQFRGTLREMVRELGMLNRKIRGIDLSPLQIHILIELHKSSLGVTELSRHLCVEKASISRTVRSMEEGDLLSRVQDAHDGRATVFSLTNKGKAMLEVVNNNVNDFTSQAMSLISEQEKQQVYKAIYALNSALKGARKQRETGVVIRPITPDDNAAIAEIIRKCFKDNKAGHYEGISLYDPVLDTLSEAYKAPNTGYWVAEANGRILGGVGIGSLTGEGSEYCEMQKLYLDRDITGIGLGRRLIALALEKAEAFGYQHCYLETLDEFKSAVVLYEAFGFKYLDNSLGNTNHDSCKIWMLKTLGTE